MSMFFSPEFREAAHGLPHKEEAKSLFPNIMVYRNGWVSSLRGTIRADGLEVFRCRFQETLHIRIAGGTYVGTLSTDTVCSCLKGGKHCS